MTVETFDTRPELARHPLGVHSTAWWGMVILIVNEAVIFLALIASYLYLRFNSPDWPQGGIRKPELILPILLTVILLSSSGFMAWAQRSIQKDKTAKLSIGLAAAFLLALIFLGLQGFEYSRSEFSPTTNAYASLFFGITGLHGLHVIAAVIMNGVIQVRAAFKHFDSQHYNAVENVTLYWHFVDAVWLVVLSVVYLSVYL